MTGEEDRLRVPTLHAEQLLQVLGEHRVELVIIGGWALSVHGVVRATKDIDIVPAPAPWNLTRLAQALAAVDAVTSLERARRP